VTARIPAAFSDDWAAHLRRTLVDGVWARPGLSPRVRSLATVGALATVRCGPELRTELDAALTRGLTAVELYEAMVQVAGYAGFPAGNTALAVLAEVVDDDEDDLPVHPGPGDDRLERARALLAVLRPDLQAGPPAGMAPRPFALGFNRWLVEAAFGDLWLRPNLSLVDREWVTIGVMVALGHELELDAHFRSAHYLGLDPDEIREAIIHLAVYVGFSFAGKANRIAAEVFDELEAATDPARSDG
jgi:4-carboxymuconolactone decarboxylase